MSVPPTLGNPSGPPILNTEKIDFANNIVSAGVSPIIGVNASRRLSIDIGVDLVRNINTRLSVQNNDSIVQAIKNTNPNNIIADKNINPWNVGLVNHLNYDMTKNLGLTISFRYGLSNYIDNSSTYRNTGLGLGIKYRFSK